MKQWKRLAALSSAIVMAAATLTYFPSDTLQNIRLEISASADETSADETSADETSADETSADETSAATWTKTESDGLTWTLDADGTLTISGTGAMKDYDYDSNPSPVYHNSKVKKIVIENGVTSIGEWAFYSSGLNSVTIPDSVTSIGSHAFYDCSSLTSITIPNSVTSIGEGAFHYCSSLTSITIPDSVTNIEDYAFYKCSSLTSITIPDSVTSIGYKAFENCSSLTSITIPKSVTSIGSGVFHNCNNLTVYLENGSTLTSNDLGVDESKIVSYSQWNEDNLTWKLDADGTLNISGTGTMKDYDSNDNPSPATQKKDSIKKVVIEDGVTSIGKYAFWYCSNLTSITIPDSVTSIGDAAFRSCSSLTSITIPNSVTSIGYAAFYDCSNLTSITIPDSVTSIGNYAFRGCTSLTSITIPDGVISIGAATFSGCTNLTSITIPDSVTSIGSSAFSCCTSLTSITIPDSVTSIGEWAFAFCQNLPSITIPDSVTSIGDSVFEKCTNLQTISLSCKSTLKRSDFGDKADLVSYASHTLKKTEAKTVTCSEDGNKEYWTCEHCGKYFLSDDTNPETAKAVELSETILPALKHKNETLRGASKPDGTKPGYSGDRYCPDCDTVLEKGYTYWKEDNLTWKLDADGTLTISGTGAMKNYDYYYNNPSPAAQKKGSVKKVVIEDGVTSIGDYAFDSCSNLTSIAIPDSVTSIGRCAFYNCNSLTSITIPKSVTSIGYYAFSNCRSLTSITIPDSVISIGTATFLACKNLTSITIPDSVTSIGSSAFMGCTSLTSITIPDSVTGIGNRAFENCSSLQTISLSCKSSLKKSNFGDQADLVSASHTLKKTEAKAKTCTEDGNKEYWTCEHCGKYFLSDDTNPETAKAVEQSETIIPASHKLTKVKEAKDATCAENGNKAYWTCEHCKKYFLSDDTNPETAKAVELSETVIPASHKLTKVEAKAATCSENGNKEYWTCEHCKKYFLSDDANPETAKAVEQSEFIIPASHKLTKVDAKDATCAENGNKAYWTCEHCGKYFLSDDTNPATAKAVELSETILPAIQHKNAELRNSSEPTETSPGYSGDLYCPDCDKVVEKGYTYWNEGNLTWKLYEDGTLTISGTGAMKDYDSDSNPSPVYNNWDVEKIVIEDGVTSIGDSAFERCNSLISITIPNSVTSIGIRAFNVCRNLTNITIPDNVTSIGNYAFHYCENLTSVTIPNSVTSIGDFAFYNCRSLTSITIPDRVTSIGNFVFEGCKGLTSITIPDSITSIGDFAFRYCTSLTSITIPDRVTSIGNAAFESCSSLTSITIPDSVTSIGNSAFFGCKGLTSITIPNNITIIKDSTFLNCSSLTSITIPDSVTSIGGSAFYYCSGLTSITIPDSVTSIGSYAFYKCTGLTSITIPDSVTSIGKYTFKNCSSLTSITIPDSVTSIGDSAFSNCESLTAISLSCKSSLKKSDFGEQADLVSYTLHTLKKTEAKAATCSEDGNKEYWTCEHCKKYFLSDDTNPETAKAVELSETVISASHKLTKVEAKAATCTENGNKEYWTCEHCGKYFLSDDSNPETAKAVELSETVIPASHKLTKVEAKDATCAENGNKEYWTCEHCKKYFLSDDTNPETAKAVELSETVIPALKHKNATTRGASEPTETAPGYSGDRYCPDCDTVLEKGYTYWNEGNLTWKLYEDGTLTISGTGAMKDYNSTDNLSPAYMNSSVKKVVIEEGVTNIGNWAFSECSSLTSITIPDSVTNIGAAAFDSCGSLTSITIPGSVTNIGTVAFYNCSGLTSITIPDSVTNIGAAAFDSCGSLTSIVIPNSVTSIESYAFSACSSLTSITIPDSVTSIGSNAFDSCSSLTSITIPDSVTSIGNNAFDSCSSLTSITIPDGVTSIESYAFCNCSNLTSITIPDSVTNIGAAAFENCTSLTSITIPDSVTSIESYAFYNCSGLTSITIPDSVTNIGAAAFDSCTSLKTISLSCKSSLKRSDFGEQVNSVSYASHTLKKTEAKAATYAENGNKAYWTCEHCGKYFLSDDSNPETAKAVELSETVIPALVQVATTTTPIKCVYGQDMNKINLRDYVKNTDVVGEVTVKVATGSTLPDGMKLDGSNLSGKPAKAYEDSKEVTFTFTAENGSTENLTLLFLVAKADPTVEIAVSGDSHTEGDLVRELKLILSENSTKGVVELVSEIKALVAGKNTFTWKFTPEDENNYNMVTGTVVVNAQTTTTTTTTKATTTTTTKATTTTTTKATTTTTTTTISFYGDVNLDGKVDILDAVYLNRYLATLIQFSDVQIANADCYQDGVLDDQDTTALMQFIILLIDDLPAQPTEK